MILTAVVCAHPPLLLRELCGRQDAVPALRHAAHEALQEALALDPEVVWVVGGGRITGGVDARLPVDVRGFGTSHAPRVEGLPQSLGVGKRLLEEAGWDGSTRMRRVMWTAPDDDLGLTAHLIANDPRRGVLLVLADGSARRGEKAPGYLDERAFAYDEATVRALGSGDVKALASLDRCLAQELMVLGWAPLMVLADVAHRQDADVQARLLHHDDPYGVAYTVALWRLSGE